MLETAGGVKVFPNLSRVKKGIMTRREEVIGAAAIAARVAELGRRIDQDYQGLGLVLIGVLNGAFIFIADLARAITIPHQVDFVRVASYGASSSSSGRLRLTKEVELPIAGKHLLLVEDIVDSGRTLAGLRELLLAARPASLRICALIDKQERREVAVTVDYAGFTVADGFLVGYGLDYAEQHRHYPAVYRLLDL